MLFAERYFRIDAPGTDAHKDTDGPYVTGPFLSFAEHLSAWMRFVDMLCAMSLHEADEKLEDRRLRIGTLQNELDADELVAPPGSAFSETPAYLPMEERRAARDVFADLLEAGCDIDGRPADALSRLLMKLEPLEAFAAVLALCASANRKYERVFLLLSEERQGVVRPTAGLCVDLARFFLTDRERDLSLLIARDSFFSKCVMTADDTAWDSQLSHPLALQAETLAFVMGEPLPGRDTPFLTRLETAAGRVNVRPAQCAELARLIGRLEDRMLSQPLANAPAVLLTAEEGAGKRFLLRAAADACGASVLSVDVRLLAGLSDSRRDAGLASVLRTAVLGDAFVYLYHLPEEEDGLAAETAQILSVLSSELSMLLIGVESAAAVDANRLIAGPVIRMELEPVSAAGQEILWQAAADENGVSFAENVSLREIVSKYAMTPGRIAAAMNGAALAASDGRTVDAAVLEDQIRLICSVEFGQNATRLSSPFTWDDLMVGENSAHLLRLAADRVRLRAVVLEDFGFGAKLPYGRGVSIVLYGPPGTGKTMAAQVLARELGLSIYRVDLSQISSKYIGETEKNLGSIFDAAKHSNAVLFFDEADALFSKRTEVSSSHDKYANAETSYLLQKIEEYDGVSVLATNNLQNFDIAFKRRMTYIIPLEMPDEETRRRLWEKVFPAETPVDARVDFGLLARTLELSGAQIKAVAAACAYRAAAGGRSVCYEDLIESVEIECQKTGTLQAGEKLRQAVMMGA